MSLPAKSQRLQALEAIQTKLRAISGQPTYNFQVKSTSVVLDPSVNILTVPPTELPYFIVEPTPDGSKFYMPAMRLKHQFQVAVTARIDAESAVGTARKTEAWEKLIHDIEVALTRDITLGGVAVDVRLQEATPGFDLGAVSTIIVVQPLIVTMIRTYGEP